MGITVRTRFLSPCLFGLLLLGAALLAGCTSQTQGPPPATTAPLDTAELTDQIHRFCGSCHAYPPAETFRRRDWKNEVERGYAFFAASNLPLQAPPIDEVVKYYEERAPLEMPVPNLERSAKPFPVSFDKMHFPEVAHKDPPAVSNLNLVHLFDKKRLDVLACDMRRGQVLALRPYAENPTWELLGQVSHPAHAEVADLDGDQIPDVLVANLGNFKPTDRLLGSVVWLRGLGNGKFQPYTLLENVGRIADVRAADFNGDGKLDLIVAAFGWNTTGEIYYLENKTTDWTKPQFVTHMIDNRHGAIHVPIADLNKDGRPDFVTLISQEHEAIVAFLNEGEGRFRKETIYKAPHPGYGSSGIELVDLNGDGELDVLYTNGDVLDQPYFLKPYHSIQWLENPGVSRPDKRNAFPWVHHPLAPMYGVHRAVAADLDQDGDLDILAVSFLPVEGFPERKKLDLDAVIVLEQTAPGKFTRHALETVTCDHVTCAVGDLFGTGRADVVMGNFTSTPLDHAITFWKNPGKRK
jgi:hypothetical protein